MGVGVFHDRSHRAAVMVGGIHIGTFIGSYKREQQAWLVLLLYIQSG